MTPGNNRFVNHPILAWAGVAIFLFLFLIAGDLLLGRIFLPTLAGRPHPYYHHDLKKKFRGMVRWGDSMYLMTTNSLGFKDKQRRNISLSSPKHRILFLGDSFTEGVGYSYEKTFVGIFEDILNSKKFEVLNAGVKSYSPKLYYLKMRHLLEKTGLEVDEIFVFIDISDIQDEIVYRNFSPDRNWVYQRLRDLKAFINQRSYALNKLIAWSDSRRLSLIHEVRNNPAPDQGANTGETEIAVPFIPGGKKTREISDAEEKTSYDFWGRYYLDRDRWLYDAEVFSAWGKEGLSLSDDYLEKLQHLCLAHGIKMHIAVYPWPEEIIRKDRASLNRRYWQEFAKRHGIGFFDFYPVFLNAEKPQTVVNRYYYPGDVHWSGKGHQLVAEKLYKYWREPMDVSKQKVESPGRIESRE